MENKIECDILERKIECINQDDKTFLFLTKACKLHSNSFRNYAIQLNRGCIRKYYFLLFPQKLNINTF